MSSLSSNLFRTKKINKDGQKFVFNSFVVIISINFIIMLTNSIYLLFSLKLLHDSILQLSYLLAFFFIIVVITDYPTSFITRLTQKQILIISSVLYLTSFYFFSISTNFNSLLLAYFFMALAQGQESDAFRRYFEDNYYFYVQEDQTRSIYNTITNRMNFLIGISTILSFVVGGIISSYIHRPAVFQTQVVLLLVAILMTHFLLKDYPQKFNQKKPNQFQSTLKENVKFCWSNKSLRYFIIGSAITGSTLTIFGTLIIFKLYEQYALANDLTIGILRSLILIFAGVFSLIISHILVNVVKNKAWTITILLISSISIFIATIFFIDLYNIPSSLNYQILFMMIIFIVLGMIPQALYKSSKEKYLLQIVPQMRKEDVFSLIPVIITIINIPVIILGGYLIQNYNLVSALEIMALISVLGALITSWSYYIFTYKLPKQELITRTLNVYFGGQFEINAFTNIQLPVKYIWEKFTFSATKLWEDIVNQAVSDGSLSKDERVLIEKIMLQVRTYGLALEDVIEDAVITIEEEKRLEFIRTQLFNIVFEEARKDGVVTEEEFKLIQIFKKHLENFKEFSRLSE